MSYEYSCHYCDNLDKSRKGWDDSHYCYFYGCNANGRTRTVGWCREDSELKLMGCSFFEKSVPIKERQISFFDEEIRK